MKFYIVRIDLPKYQLIRNDILHTSPDSWSCLDLANGPIERAKQVLKNRTKATGAKYYPSRPYFYSGWSDSAERMQKEYGSALEEITEDLLAKDLQVKHLFEAIMPHLPDHRGQHTTPKKEAKKLHRRAFKYESKVAKVELRKYLIYKGVTVERGDAKAISDLRYALNRGFVNWNHGHRPQDIIGEPIKFDHDFSEVLKVDLKIYKQHVALNFEVPLKHVGTYIEQLVPSIAGQILERNVDGSIKALRLTGISLGQNNVDPFIKPIAQQMK